MPGNAPIWKDGRSSAAECVEMHSIYIPTRVPAPVPPSQLLPAKVSEALPHDLSMPRTQADTNANEATSMQWVAQFCSEDAFAGPAQGPVLAPLLPAQEDSSIISVVDTTKKSPVSEYHMAELVGGYTVGAAFGVRR